MRGKGMQPERQVVVGDQVVKDEQKCLPGSGVLIDAMDKDLYSWQE